MGRSCTLLAAVAVMIIWATQTWAQTQHENQARGFNPQHTYDTHDIDSVNVLNGNLVLSIPIGQRYSRAASNRT